MARRNRNNLKFVWPKDVGHDKNGKMSRSTWSGFKDILTGKGPDMFIQREGSKSPIKPDRWSNWDSYHSRRQDSLEQADGAINPFWNSSRKQQRYDPHTRKYVDWKELNDWPPFNSVPLGVGGMGLFENGDGYPHFTRGEWNNITRQIARRGYMDPSKMGSGWTDFGPMRYRTEYDHFWQQAHRIGENLADQLSPDEGPNFFFRKHQCHPNDLQRWIDLSS